MRTRQTLNGEAHAAMTSTNVADKLRAAGTEPVGSSAEQFRTFLAAEIAQWATVAGEGSIRIEQAGRAASTPVT